MNKPSKLKELRHDRHTVSLLTSQEVKRTDKQDIKKRISSSQGMV
jgi:hypothetical protein